MLRYFKRKEQRFGLPEMAILITLALVGGGVWAFVEIAEEVSERETIDFDRRVLESMRQSKDPSRPLGPLWLLQMARDITSLGSYTVLLLIGGIVAVFFGLRHNFGLMYLSLVAVAGGALIGTGLKLLFSRERPTIEHLVDVSTYSFPSGHALLSAVAYLTFGALLASSESQKRFKVFFMCVAALLTVLVGASRVYLGVHFATDVLAGWLAGAVWAFVCLQAAGLLQRRMH